MEESKIEGLLVALLLTALKGSTMAEKAKILKKAGLNNVEIADYLETTSASIASLLHGAKKAKKK